MKIGKPIIPILHKIAELARAYAHLNPDLTQLLRDLDEAEEDQALARKEALESRGLDCVVCGKRFLPLPGDFSACCSLGCKFS